MYDIDNAIFPVYHKNKKQQTTDKDKESDPYKKDLNRSSRLGFWDCKRMIGYASNTKGLFKLEHYFVDGKIIKSDDDMRTFKL